MKNMDPLNDSVAALLHQSTDRLTAEIWKDGKVPFPPPAGAAATGREGWWVGGWVDQGVGEGVSE